MSLWKIWEKRGQRNGLRHAVFDIHGNHYIGEWKNDKMHGKGTYTWKTTGLIYSGDWVDGERSGHGILSAVYQKGRRFVRRYIGEWKKDKPHGPGVCFEPNGHVYDGEWINGMKEGFGKKKYPNGDVYDGQWKMNQRSGRGLINYHNGDCYEGEWKRDCRNGPGLFYSLKKGLVTDGFWLDDVMKCGTVTKFPPTKSDPIPECSLLHPEKIILESVLGLQK